MSPEVSILSVIIPARDESQNLIECINEIVTALNRNDIKHEILVIDDGFSLMIALLSLNI